MVISFNNKKLQKVCSIAAEAIKAYGADRAKKLMQRMAELSAAPTLKDISYLPPPRCHELQGDRKGTFSVDLAHPYRLLFEPDHDPVPQKEDGGIDTSRVTAVLVKNIEDTH